MRFLRAHCVGRRLGRTVHREFLGAAVTDLLIGLALVVAAMCVSLDLLRYARVRRMLRWIARQLMR